MSTRLANRGLCVSDLARSAAFYEAVFGFHTVAARRTWRGTWLDAATGVPGSQVDAWLLTDRRGISLQLLEFGKPAAVGSRQRRPINAYGHTHVNYYVRDFEQTLTDVATLGGTVHRHTFLDSTMADGTRCPMVYCTDPDGIRIEVWTTEPYGAGGSVVAPISGIDRKFSHSGVCVSDTARSLQFYAQLGLNLAETFDYRGYPGALDVVLELQRSELLAQMMRGPEPDVVELLYFAHPAAVGTREPVPFNHYGYNHLAFWVDDLETTAAGLVKSGGRSLAPPGEAEDGIRRQCLADPDGARVLLQQADGSSRSGRQPA